MRVCVRTPFLFIHLSVNGHLSRFYLLAIGNNAAIKVGLQISHRDPDFNYLGYIHRGGIAESHGNPIFNFLRDRHTVFLAAKFAFLEEFYDI